jgi:hypothetical protein
MKLIRNALLLGAAISALAALVIYLGIFDVAADVPHSGFASSVIQLVRDRSITGLTIPARYAASFTARCTVCSSM